MKYNLFIDSEDDILCVGTEDKPEHVFGIASEDIDFIETVECSTDLDCDVCMHKARGTHAVKGKNSIFRHAGDIELNTVIK